MANLEAGSRPDPPSAPYTGPSIFHVGYIKTATTYLQNEVFSSADLGLALGGGEGSRGHLISWFVTCDDYAFDPSVVKEEIVDLEKRVRRKGLVPIWSDETLLGNPIARSYLGRSNLTKLASIPIPKKVIITIREQRALCLSAYKQFINQGGANGIRDFIGTGNEGLSYTPILRPEFLFFDRALSRFREAIGAEGVLVLPYEMLIHDPESYFSKLKSFLGVGFGSTPPLDAQNIGLGGVSLELRRFLNRFFVRSPLSQRLSLPERAAWKVVRIANRLTPRSLDKALEAGIRERIEKRYAGLFAASNRRLESDLGYDLRRYGYQ